MLFMDAFGAQGINPSRKKTPQFFNQNQNGLKNPSVYGQNGVKAPRLMGYVVKHARCSGLTATYKIEASYQSYHQ